MFANFLQWVYNTESLCDRRNMHIVSAGNLHINGKHEASSPGTLRHVLRKDIGQAFGSWGGRHTKEQEYHLKKPIGLGHSARMCMGLTPLARCGGTEPT